MRIPDEDEMGKKRTMIARFIYEGVADLVSGIPAGSLMGLGIDIEADRMVHPDAARFFLTDAEREWLRRENEESLPETLLRIWTAKEAVLKADSASSGRLLGDYGLNDPGQWIGIARRTDNPELNFHYTSIRVGGGFFSIAAALKGDNNA